MKLVVGHGSWVLRLVILGLMVVGRVEVRWPTTVGASLLAVACLVGFVRDGAADPPAAQVGAVLAGGVCLVSPHAIGADARPTRPDVGHADLAGTGSNCG